MKKLQKRVRQWLHVIHPDFNVIVVNLSFLIFGILLHVYTKSDKGLMAMSFNFTEVSFTVTAVTEVGQAETPAIEIDSSGKFNIKLIIFELIMIS